MENTIVNKPNPAIVISSKDLTLTQKKAYNVMLKQAELKLKEGFKEDWFYVDLDTIIEYAGIENKNYNYLKNDLLKLKSISVEVLKDSRNWNSFNLLSEVAQEEDMLKYALPPSVKKALLDSNYYTPLDMIVMRNLKSKYSVTLYEVCKRYVTYEREVELPILDLRKLMGTETEYNRYFDFKKRVIDVAVSEINEKTDINVEVFEIKKKRVVNAIKFSFKIKKTEYIERKEKKPPVEKSEKNEDLELLYNLLPLSEQIEKNKVKLEKMLSEHSVEFLKNDIEYCKKKKTTNFFAYFVKSVKEGHYSSEEIAKNEKKKEIVAKQLKLISDEKDNEKNNEEMLENKAKEIIENMSEEEKEEYIKLHSSSKISAKVDFESWLIAVIKMKVEEEGL